MSFQTLQKKPAPTSAQKTNIAAQPSLKLVSTTKPKPLQLTTPPPGYVKGPDGQPRSELDATQLKKARAWYAANAAQYTPNVIAQIQTRIHEPATGKITDSFVQAVAYWQISFDLYAAAGRDIQVGNTLHGGYLPTGVLTPEQVSRLFPSGLARPTQIAAYATTTEDLIAKWNSLGGYDGRRKALYALLEQQLKAAGVRMPIFDLVKLPPGSYGTYRFGDHTLTVNSDLLKLPNASKDQIRTLFHTLYHEARHAEQAFAIARLLHGSGMTTDGILKKFALNADLVKSAATKPIRPDSPEGIVANEWYQATFGALAAQTSADLNYWAFLRRLIASNTKALASLHAERSALQQKLKGALSNENRAELTEDLRLVEAQIKSLDAGLKKQKQEAKTYYAKYRALPDERDAWDVEGAVDTYYLRKLAKK